MLPFQILESYFLLNFELFLFFVLVYSNVNFGANLPPYYVTDEQTALERAELSSLFLFAIPGPKMIWQFQELGYDYSINHCPDGSISDGCRVSEKPIRWDYAQDENRRQVYNTVSRLAHLKTTYPIFATSSFTVDVGANKADKRIVLKSGNERVFVLGNFDVTSKSFTQNFDVAGWYYEFFSGDSMYVQSAGEQSFTFTPGEYRMYSTRKFFSDTWPLSTPKTDAPQSAVQIYPNPASDNVFIESELGLNRIEVFTQLGNKVWETEERSTKVMLNVSSFSSGIYIVKCTDNGKVSSFKMMIGKK